MPIAAKMIETALDSLVPSRWEIEVTFAATAFVIAAYCYFTLFNGRCNGDDESVEYGDGDERDKVFGDLIFLVHSSFYFVLF